MRQSQLTEVLCEAEPFVAVFLGGPAYRLRIPPDATAIESQVSAILDRVTGARLVSCRLEASAPAADTLTRLDFREIERLVTFERPVPDDRPKLEGCMPADGADHDACIEIARSAFAFDRFHADPAIEKESADALKCQWVANDLDGRADSSLVLHRHGRVAGFVLCLRTAEAAIIDLIAVAPEMQGNGLGKTLVRGALGHYAGRARVMRVGTQENNAASIRLYQATGFIPVQVQRTFHFTPASEAAA